MKTIKITLEEYEDYIWLKKRHTKELIAIIKNLKVANENN